MFLKKELMQNYETQAKDMKKRSVFIGILVIIICVAWSGCQSTNTAEAKIIGKWQNTNSTDIEILDFLENGNFSLTIAKNRTWGIYTITEKTLVLHIFGRNASYEYSLSNNNQKLTIVSLGDKNISAVFIRF